jgi:outer membrane receptor protein involved in Fe transport
MTSRYPLARAIRNALLLGAFCAGGTAAAQESPPAGNEGAATIEEIVVTGSRIATTNLESVAPLQIIGAEDIAAAGAPNVQDVLLQNPTFGTPAISRTNSNFSTSSAGVATVDLRNLGTSRTLVLVDGRRFVAGIPGESAVDLNAIPAQFIERIDIVTGGQSATYGSDAIAGVVNIIYKKRFEGIEFNGQYGASDQGDNRETQLGLTLGTTTSDGRGNIMAHVGYTDQTPVFSRDRARSAVDQISEGAAFSGDPAEFFVARQPFYSSFAPQGRFFAGDDEFTYDANNNLLTGWSTNGTATRAANGYNRSAMRTIALPVERYLFASRGDFEWTDNHKVFFEGTYASSQVKTELEPYALGAEDIYPATGGQVPVEFEVFTPGAVAGQFTRTVLRNPVVPTAIYNAATDTDADGLRDIYFTRRMSDVGNRGSVADRDTFRVLGGFQGELDYGRGWSYEAFYAYGQTKEAQTSGGQVNVLNFRNALEAVPDVGDIDGDGNRTEAICRDANARAQGCVPVSVFGFNSISADAAKYIAAPGLLGTFTSQKVAGLNLSGEVIDLPAGPFAVAVGAEYREEFARSEFDPLQQAGLNAGNAIPRTEGQFDVMEYYAEIAAPLLKDLPFVQDLTLRSQVRYSDYSTIGNTISWNAGLDWKITDMVRFRGVRAQSTRAPNINELYSPPSQTFPADLVDPCLGVTANSSTGASAACRAAPGVGANIAANGAFTLNQADLQGISGFDRGNPNLSEEKGKSWSAGVVLTPVGIPVVENFGLTIDWFDIKIEDAIVSTPRQFILDQCYSGDSTFCQFITRRPAAVGANSAGSIEFIDSAVTNSGGLRTRGVDVTLTYAQSLEQWSLPGDVKARLAYTRLIDGYVVPLPGAEADPFAGEVGASKDRFFLSVGYSVGDFGIDWRTTFIGKSYLDDTFLAGYDLAPESVGIGSVTYHDLQARYTVLAKVELFLGVNNVFDKDPPPLITGLPFNTTGAETDSGTYDAIGRRYYGGFRVKF